MGTQPIIKPASGSPPDYLSESTRKVRRALLLACSVAWAWTWLGLVPQRIVALGIEFDRIDQRRFKWFILAVVLYFLIEFLVFLRRDYLYLLFEEPLLSAKMAEKIPVRDHYKWGFWYPKLKTPELFRDYIGEESTEESLGRVLRKRFGLQSRTSVFPIPKYGFQCWMDVWIPLILAVVAIVSLVLWTPRLPPYIPWP